MCRCCYSCDWCNHENSAYITTKDCFVRPLLRTTAMTVFTVRRPNLLPQWAAAASAPSVQLPPGLNPLVFAVARRVCV